MLKFLLPLVLFVVIAVFLAVGLHLNPHEIPSPLLNKPAPAFSAPKLNAPSEKLSPTDFKGQVWLLNVWASWCVSCRAEHAMLHELHKMIGDSVPLIGLNYKDDSKLANAMLTQLGDPYTLSVVDADGRIGINWGVYGVPETFVIDKKGVVRYKFTGAITADDAQKTFLPLIAQLQAES